MVVVVVEVEGALVDEANLRGGALVGALIGEVETLVVALVDVEDSEALDRAIVVEEVIRTGGALELEEVTLLMGILVEVDGLGVVEVR